MTSWLRVLGLRVVLLGALVATVLATHMVASKPDLPFVLLDSFDQAFALYDAAQRKVAERNVAELEAMGPSALPRGDVFAILHELEGHVTVTCDAASAELDVELARAGSLSPGRRNAVLGCIEHHLSEARHALVHARDPEERAEYEATHERLREVSEMV